MSSMIDKRIVNKDCIPVQIMARSGQFNESFPCDLNRPNFKVKIVQKSYKQINDE